MSRFLAPAQSIDGTLFRFGPRYTLFLTYALRRTPTRADGRALEEALAALP